MKAARVLHKADKFIKRVASNALNRDLSLGETFML